MKRGLLQPRSKTRPYLSLSPSNAATLCFSIHHPSLPPEPQVFRNVLKARFWNPGWINYYVGGEKMAERTTKVQWGSSVGHVGERFKKESITPLEGDMWGKLLEADQSNNLIVVTFEFKGRGWGIPL